MIKTLKRVFGEKYGAVMFIAIVFLVVMIMLAMSKCATMQKDRQISAQTKQGNASAEAITRAASEAVETVQGRGTTEQQIDAATEQAKREIGNAENSDEIRAAVLRALCGDGMQHHPTRDDTACGVQ
jgi:Tfp pilus assembly protein PilX